MTTWGLPQPETLSLTAQVAQLVVVRASGHSFDHQRRYPQWELSNAALERAIAEWQVGGVILLGGSAVEVGVRSQQLQSWANIPLLIAADIEEGVGQRFAGATQFPPPMALAAIAASDFQLASELAQAMGAITAQEALAIGVNWLLAPVVDVNNNADNPVINVRAFGGTPEQVCDLTRAFIHGAQQFPVLTTAKHFPGHGDTATDSHLHLPQVAHNRRRLEQVELPPFRTAIAQGIDAIMTAHLQVTAYDSKLPATLSPAVLQGLLREQLGFNGLIVTDALIMGAIAHHYGPYEAAVMALEAGADVLLMPTDIEGTIQAVAEAVRTGRLSRDRVLASVERIWRAKQKVNSGLTIPPETCHAWEHMPPPPVQLSSLSTASSRATLMRCLHASTQVQGQIMPQSGMAAQSIILIDDVLSADWLSPQAAAIARPSQQGYTVRLVDEKTCSLPLEALASPSIPTLLQVFSRGNPFRGRAGLSDYAWRCFERLKSEAKLVGLVVYGSPYVLERLRHNLPAAMPYGFTFGQTPEAQSVVLSRLLPQVSAAQSQVFTD